MIDSHCHLDALEYSQDRQEVLHRAFLAGVTMIVNPAVSAANFNDVKQLSLASEGLHQQGLSPRVFYALGIHPMYVDNASLEDLDLLKLAIVQSLNDPRFVGVGEIGLDGFVPGLDQAKQLVYFEAQLRIAKDFDLPVIMHVRRAQDAVLKQLRRYKPKAGIAHAFNGSEQQAFQFCDLGCVLGFGGAMTFTRALQIRRLAQNLPMQAIVLETDSPDISPSWQHPARNEPCHVEGIAKTLAELRSCSITDIQISTSANVRRTLPRMV
jgi:TatD DNase family protein